jgi:hypothetical protein
MVLGDMSLGVKAERDYGLTVPGESPGSITRLGESKELLSRVRQSY